MINCGYRVVQLLQSTDNDAISSQNDVLAFGAIKKVHRGSEVTELDHPANIEDQTRKKIFLVKVCL